MSENDIIEINPITFRKLQNLSSFRLVDIKLKRIDCELFKDLSNLLLIQMGSNSINEIDSNAFQSCKAIKLLHLHENKLVSFEKMYLMV